MSVHESLSIATKLPHEIWTTILNFAFDPAEEYFYSSRKAIINVLSEVSHDFHQLIKKLGISTATKQLPHADDDIACYCCANGYETLLKHALMSGKQHHPKEGIIAARNGNLNCLKVLEEHGQTLSEGVLEEASQYGHVNVIKHLLSIGMTPGCSAFDYAIKSGDVEFFKFLVMQSPEIIFKKDWACFVAHLAARSGNLEMVKLAEQYLPLNSSSIWLSASKGSTDILQYYIDKGFTLTDEVGICKAAAEHKQWEYLKFALDHGAPMSVQLMEALAKVNAVELMQEMRAKGCPWDINAVREAAEKGHLEALKFLIENGCPFTTPQSGWNKMHGNTNYATEYAAKNGHVECLKYLIEIGAPVVDDIIDKCKDFVVIKYLHELGYSWTAETSTTAAFLNNLALLKYLHKNNCPWDERTAGLAARYASIECLVFALDNGCPWNDSTINCAAVSGSLEALKICHQKGLPWNDWTSAYLVQASDVEMLKYAHENGAYWTDETITSAIKISRDLDQRAFLYQCFFDCFKYAIDHGCPWDPQRTLEMTELYFCQGVIAQWIRENCNLTKPDAPSD